MPVYEYFCRECGTTFERLYRRAGTASDRAACPAGHRDAARTLSLFATTGRASGTEWEPPAGGGGGCCGGGGCACSAGGASRN